jgi:DNA-binding transcriptional regulator YiaG
MSKVLEKYIFTGFGFDVLLRDVVVKNVHGEAYPDVNMNELKLKTVKALLVMPIKLTGYQIKFLRTFLKLSFDDLSEKIDIPASTIRSWENRGAEVSGLSIEHEKAFRIYAVHAIFDLERTKMDKGLILRKEFALPMKNQVALDIAKIDIAG